MPGALYLERARELRQKRGGCLFVSKLNFDFFPLKTGENSSLARLRMRAYAQLLEFQYLIFPIIPSTRVIQNSAELKSISNIG
jgi:hypothetical protein